MKYLVGVVVATCVLLALGVSPAHAARPDEEAMKAKLLEQYDFNKDGKLDADEKAVMAEIQRDQKASGKKPKPGDVDFRAKLLEQFDANKDGKLDETEMKAAREAMEKFRRRRLANGSTNNSSGSNGGAAVAPGGKVIPGGVVPGAGGQPGRSSDGNRGKRPGKG